ncbi:mucolipin-3 isoform 3-T4 [Alca torda]
MQMSFTEDKHLWSPEMEDPEVAESSCSAHDDDNLCSYKRHLSVSQEGLLEDQLRRKLKFFFMNPCEKFWARGRKPWKLGIQLLKIAMVTLQLVVFGLSNQMVVAFKEENTVAFKHLFLKGYMDRMDDTYAVYTQTDVYDQIFFAINQYLQLPNISVGNHAYEKRGAEETALAMCQQFYKRGTICPGNDTFDIDPEIVTDCLYIEPMTPLDNTTVGKHNLNFTLDFHRLVAVQLMFNLKAINLQTVRHHELPDCYDFTLTIVFDNKAHSGRIKISLDNDIAIRECKDWHVSGSIQKNTHYMMIFDAFVILTCLASLILCTRSVVKGIGLQREFVSFFLYYYKKEVSFSDQMEFVNGWYILIMVSDVLTIVGSTLKMEIQAKSLTSYDVCSILLGTSTMLVWLGVIRYLGFFQKYNVRISWDLRAVASHPNTASSITQRNEVLLLCGHDLPGLLFLWMDRTGTIPCKVSLSEHGFRMPFFVDQWRRHVCHLCKNAAEKLLGLVIQQDLPLLLHQFVHLYGAESLHCTHYRYI